MMQVLQPEEVPVRKFGKEIEIVDMSLTGERVCRLELRGPNASIGEGLRMGAEVDRRKWKRGIACGVAKSTDAKLLPVPGRIVLFVTEHIAGMIQDDIENDAHPHRMRSVHQPSKIISRAKVGIHIEEVLNTIAMVAVVCIYLLEHRADPQHCHPEAFQIA